MSVAADFQPHTLERSQYTLPWTLPVRHLSASSVSLAAECPEKWRRRYIVKEPEKVGPALVLGSAFHGAMEKNFAQKVKSGKDLSSDEMQHAYGLACVKALEEKNAVDFEGKTEDEVFNKGWEMVATYMDEVAPRIQPLGVEVRIRQPIPGIPVPFLGFIDLIKQGGMVDYKTASRKTTGAKPGWQRQGRIYQMTHPIGFEWHVVTKTETPQVLTPLEAPGLSMPYSQVAIQEAMTDLRNIAWTLNYYHTYVGWDSAWPTNGIHSDGACRRCSFREGCPAWRS